MIYVERVNALLRAASRPSFWKKFSNQDHEEAEPGDENGRLYPVISVPRSLLFAQERHSERYVCYVHCFVHNFSDNALVVTNLMLVVKEIALESVPREPSWPVSYESSSLPLVIQPQGYIEFHVYFKMGTTLRQEPAELLLTIGEQTYRKSIHFSILQK